MSEAIEFIKDKRIIKITYDTEMTEKDLQKSRETLNNICNEHGYSKILVDATKFPSKFPIIEAFNHGLSLAKNFTFRNAKHAIVACDNNFKILDFISSIANGRGGNVKLFFSIDASESWLNE
jgi:hypothetical protein